MNHMDFIEEVVNEDVRHLREKEKSYRGSWKKRGGIGAWMMAARKIDRLELMTSNPKVLEINASVVNPYDIFAIIRDNPSGDDSTALAEIRDLRRYLILIEAEMIAQQVVPVAKLRNLMGPGTPEDGGHHERQGVRHIEIRTPYYAVRPRLEDGINSEDWKILNTTDPLRGEVHCLVDRPAYHEEQWAHLPRLRIELNNLEWTELQPEYRGLYEWDGPGSKQVMKKEYRRCWGKES